MPSEPNFTFSFKPALLLLFLGNIVLLGTWMSFISKTPVEAEPRFRTRQESGGRVTQELYMNYGESVRVFCQAGSPIVLNRTPPLVVCTTVQNFSSGNL
jgi:hypothetical protein